MPSRFRFPFAWGIAASLAVLTFSLNPAYAQVVNGDFSAGNTGFTSQYLFDQSGQQAYFIVNNPAVRPPFASYGDHTTGTGLMMLMNGAASPSVYFWQQAVSVAPNSTYTFTAWAASAFFTNPAIIDFRVNGGSVGTLSLTTQQGVWTRFQGVWNSGANTTATLSMFDLATAFDGNDFTVDDISFVGPAITAAPEPGTLALVALGLMSTTGMVIRRCRK